MNSVSKIQFSSNNIDWVSISPELKQMVRAKSKQLKRLGQVLNQKADSAVLYNADEYAEARILAKPKPQPYLSKVGQKYLKVSDLKGIIVDLRNQREQLLEKYRELRAYVAKARRVLSNPRWMQIRKEATRARIEKNVSDALCELQIYALPFQNLSEIIK